MKALVEALQQIANLEGMTLLGPDSKHRAGGDSPCYYEKGAAAAFSQAAEIARDVLEARCTQCGETRVPHNFRHRFKEPKE